MTRDGRYTMTSHLDRQAAELRREGLSFRQIGEVLGVTDKTAKAAAERGEDPEALKLEEQEAAEMRKFLTRRWRRLTDNELVVMRGRRDGETLEAIAAKLGISKQRVYQIQERAEFILAEDPR